MTQENYIVDTQLPLELDFQALKAQGLAYIQAHSSKEWTNLNPSDPGITILEQLCYAFTELGYCGNFSMKDILTDKNGDLIVDNQFYLPQNILTTSPITVDDYVKFVIDSVPSVKNVVITPISLAFPFVNGMYEVYVVLNPNYSNPSVIDEPENETFSVLNSCRNLGELFLMPKALVAKTYTISGNLVLKSGYDLTTILPKMMQSITDYVFPNVTQTGYNKLKASGEKTNTIFDGPSLQNGWISTKSIQPKKDTIHAFEITKIIRDTDGVQSISDVSFTDNTGATTDTATCQKDEILTFDFSKSFLKTASNTSLHISLQGKELNTSLNTTLLDELANMQQTTSQINEVASVQIAPKVPTGKYREITSYYSIQNTFPETYAVGLNATNDSTPDYEVAQSRQLKGYLSLFDQILSNQFAQLANIDKLFSFKNAITGTPSDLEHYNSVKTAEEKANPKYPVPFKVFSPTYFYQSLYESVPNVEPLLRNNDIFKFGPMSEDEATLNQNNWLEYQGDPYNSYMYGLLIYTEDDTVNLQRRNDLLDHLLARHGESPLVIDTLVHGTVYSGDLVKDRVILKSVYLQNLQLLSYNRTKAYNNIGAKKLSDFVLTITEKLLQKLSTTNTGDSLSDLRISLANVLGQTSQKIIKATAEYRAKLELQKIFIKTYKHQGVFDTDRINEEEAITKQDCLDYDTLSMKLAMLLTLRPFYINFVQEVLDMEVGSTNKSKLKTLYQKSALIIWLITERKGLIPIETNLLLQSGQFLLYIKENTLSNTYYLMETALNYADFMKLSAALNTMSSTDDIATFLTNINSTYTLEKIESSACSDATFIPIENTNYEWIASVSWNNQHTMYINDSFLDSTILWIFPDYILELLSSDWQHRLSYFLDSQLPIQISAKPLYASDTQLTTLIPKYVTWYNANIHNAHQDTQTQETNATKATNDLLTELLQISQNSAPQNA
ncbi:MAG: hypothetical protein AAF617_00900 [Bacteroidota bacterium]